MPFRAALSEDDRARHDVRGRGVFEAEALAGAGFGAVGAALGGVVRGADLGVSVAVGLGAVLEIGCGAWGVRGEGEGCESCGEGGDGRGRGEG